MYVKQPEKKDTLATGKTFQTTANFSSETMAARTKWHNVFQGKELQDHTLSFENLTKLLTKNQREFYTISPRKMEGRGNTAQFIYKPIYLFIKQK